MLHPQSCYVQKRNTVGYWGQECIVALVYVSILLYSRLLK